MRVRGNLGRRKRLNGEMGGGGEGPWIFMGRGVGIL